MDSVRGASVCVGEGMRWLLTSVYGNSRCDIAAELFSYDALRSNKDCAWFEIIESDNAEGFVFYEAFVCLFL